MKPFVSQTSQQNSLQMSKEECTLFTGNQMENETSKAVLFYDICKDAKNTKCKAKRLRAKVDDCD